MKFIAFSLATIVSAVLAAPVEYFFDIQQPQDNSVFHVGESVPLSWEHGTGGKATVTVLKGTDPTEMVETSYQFEIDGNSRSTSWKVPPGLSTSEKYNFEITYNSGSNQQQGKSYSKQFSISNDAPAQQQQSASPQQGASPQKSASTQPNTMASASYDNNGGGKKSATPGNAPQQQTQGYQTNNGMRASQGRTSAQEASGEVPMQSGNNRMTMVSNGSVMGQNMGQTGQSRQGTM
ncbi:hypothetical protein K501DRAFT_271093 [Backusella circina FSU 941]|nr:hypothetical protein K501DRAFT_271093 [Backusella circina FSU 941]